MAPLPSLSPIARHLQAGAEDPPRQILRTDYQVRDWQIRVECLVQSRPVRYLLVQMLNLDERKLDSVPGELSIGIVAPERVCEEGDSVLFEK